MPVTKESLEATLRTLDVWLIIFGVLVAVGVAGESVFGFLHWRRSGELAAVQNAENLTLQESAAHAELNAAEAKRVAANAGEGTAKALADAAAANERAAEANKAAERERLARVQIEAKLADRSLTDEQLKTIARKVAPFAGQEFEITAYWDSKESLAIAERINQGLQFAGWKFLPFKEWHGMMGGVEGVLVWTHPAADDRIQEAAKALVAVLLTEGIQAELRTQNPKNPKDSKISLSVGSKR